MIAELLDDLKAVEDHRDNKSESSEMLRAQVASMDTEKQRLERENARLQTELDVAIASAPSGTSQDIPYGDSLHLWRMTLYTWSNFIVSVEVNKLHKI